MPRVPVISGRGGTISRLPQALIVVVYIAHNEGITVSLKGDAVFTVSVGFKYTRSAFYRVAAQTRVAEVGI